MVSGALVVHRGLQAVSPATRAGGLKHDPAALPEGRASPVSPPSDHPDHDRRAPAVLEELVDGIGHRGWRHRPPNVRTKSVQVLQVRGLSTGPCAAEPTKAVIEVATPVMGCWLLGSSVT